MSRVASPRTPMKAKVWPCAEEVDKELLSWLTDFITEVKKRKLTLKANTQKPTSFLLATPASRNGSEPHRQRRRSSVIINDSASNTSFPSISSRTPNNEWTGVGGNVKPVDSDVSGKFALLNPRRETLPGITSAPVSHGILTPQATSSGSIQQTIPNTSSTTPTSLQSARRNQYVHSPSNANESLVSNPFASISTSKRGSHNSLSLGVSGDFVSEENGIVSVRQETLEGGRTTEADGHHHIYSPHQSIQSQETVSSWSGPRGSRQSSISQSALWPRRGEESASDAPVPRPRLNSVVKLQGIEETVSSPAVHNVNSMSFSAPQQQSRLAQAIRAMDRNDVDNHLEKAVRLLFQLIKGRGLGRTYSRKDVSLGDRKRSSFNSNVFGASIFRPHDNDSQDGGEKRSSDPQRLLGTPRSTKQDPTVRLRSSGNLRSAVFVTANTGSDSDSDSSNSSSFSSDGYDEQRPPQRSKKTQSKKQIRERRSIDPGRPEMLTNFHAFADGQQRSPVSNPITTPAATQEDDRSNKKSGGSPIVHLYDEEESASYPPGLVITDSMDIDDLMGSRSLMDMSDFVHHTEVEKERDREGNRVLNGYVFMGSLGRGAYGKVRLAYERDNPSKKVAIKIINKSLTKNLIGQKKKGASLAEVQKEVAIMKKLRHKNIVPLQAVVDDPDAEKMYLIMDHIGGGTLLHDETNPEKIAEGIIYKSLPEPMVVKYLRQLVDGIRYLHKHHIAHRDIKPSNLLLEDGRVYIADFGVSELGELVNVRDLNETFTAAMNSKLNEEDSPPTSPMMSHIISTHITSRQSLSERPSEGGQGMAVRGQKGTPLFWPPEMFQATESDYFVDGESQDIWALGVTTYMMLTGMAPFSSSRFADLKDEISSNKEVDIPAYLSDNAQELLKSMLSKDPSRRLSLQDIRNHEFMGGFDRRTAAARGSFAIFPTDAEEEANAITVASNAIPVIKFFLKAKPFFKRMLDRARGRIKARSEAAKERIEMSISGNSKEQSLLSNTQLGACFEEEGASSTHVPQPPASPLTRGSDRESNVQPPEVPLRRSRPQSSSFRGSAYSLRRPIHKPPSGVVYAREVVGVPLALPAFREPTLQRHVVSRSHHSLTISTHEAVPRTTSLPTLSPKQSNDKTSNAEVNGSSLPSAQQQEPSSSRTRSKLIGAIVRGGEAP